MNQQVQYILGQYIHHLKTFFTHSFKVAVETLKRQVITHVEECMFFTFFGN